MKLIKPVQIFFYISLPLIIGFFVFQAPIVIEKPIKTESVGDIHISKPIWSAQALAIIFADTSKYFQDGQAHHLASNGLATAVIDAPKFIRSFTAGSKECLDDKQISKLLESLKEELPVFEDKQIFIAGIAEGALMPFINAQNTSTAKVNNLSIGFSVNLPAGLKLCPPFVTGQKADKQQLVSSPDLQGKWRSVWTDKPIDETAIFIKEKAARADTYIAAYNTPLDALLVNELKSAIGQTEDKPPIPIIEIPAAKTNDTVTLFYSGDGGWRDLDKSVADEMAKLNYSVLGVDVLRYFWERKTPEQLTADLAATMQYYRKKWGVKSFVLAGFSFGADILPVVYNRLAETDKDNIKLLVFLALGKHADFEVHVAGWLGQSTYEMPLDAELLKIPEDKILCIYGKNEKEATGTACSSLETGKAKVIELPGGHHFDKDYPKLTRLILDVYRQHGIN